MQQSADVSSPYNSEIEDSAVAYASLFKRIGAGIIDMPVVAFIFALVNAFLGVLLGGAAEEGIQALTLIELYLYWTISEVKYGQTAGKALFNIRVVDARTGDNPAVWQALVRNFFKFFVGVLWGIPAFIAISVSKKSQRVGDMLAKTAVIPA